MILDKKLYSSDKHILIEAINSVGNIRRFAQRLGITRQAVDAWLVSKSTFPPAIHCPAIEDMTYGKITRYQLRPDIFGKTYVKELSLQKKIEKGLMFIEDALKEIRQIGKGEE